MEALSFPALRGTLAIFAPAFSPLFHGPPVVHRAQNQEVARKTTDDMLNRACRPPAPEKSPHSKCERERPLLGKELEPGRTRPRPRSVYSPSTVRGEVPNSTPPWASPRQRRMQKTQSGGSPHWTGRDRRRGGGFCKGAEGLEFFSGCLACLWFGDVRFAKRNCKYRTTALGLDPATVSNEKRRHFKLTDSRFT